MLGKLEIAQLVCGEVQLEGYLLRQISCILVYGHPVTMRKALLISLIMSRVWALRHQTGEQYSAAKCTRARVAVLNVVAPAP